MAGPVFTANVDKRDLRGLKEDVRKITLRALDLLGQEGVKLLKKFVPGGARGRLGASVGYEVRPRLQVVELYVDAKSDKSPSTGTLHLPDVKKPRKPRERQVRLRVQQARFIAQFIDEGTGIYGPNHTQISPRHAEVLLIPVESVPHDEAYISAGGEKFIMRPTAPGIPGAHFSDKAADALLGRYPVLFDKAVEDVRRGRA